MENSSIEWTDHTFNPWWGCSKVSPGCAHCYAESMARRFGGDIWGDGRPRRTFGEEHWKAPAKWNRRAQRAGRSARVFCASMADVFDPEGPEEERQRLWQVITETPCLDWQLLTKRPERISEMIPGEWLDQPQPNVWLGTTVEDRDNLRRIDALRQLPATVRFLSIEPLLEDLGPLDLSGIHWVIVGGESGPGCRPMSVQWVLDIRRACIDQSVPFFFKQFGHIQNNPDKDDRSAKKNGSKAKGGRLLSGRFWNEVPESRQVAAMTT